MINLIKFRIKIMIEILKIVLIICIAIMSLVGLTIFLGLVYIFKNGEIDKLRKLKNERENNRQQTKE